ncbi:MAG: DUF5107 domain-containing protein [Candidatus Saccharicenans sp.]
MKNRKVPFLKLSLLLGLIIIGATIIFSHCSLKEKASVTVKKETIPTYPFSDPDPIPVFGRSSLWGSGAKIYPYFVYNGFSFNSQPKEWAVVRLKNKYLEVSILPEVGGKVWGAKNLKTGREFIYTNKVIKFREIALRGPWTSGGIEFNFGIIGHSPSTATPVDYYVSENSDGRISCTIGNYDWPSRTRWQVTITVFPDKAYFETRARWTNPSPFHQSYYAWMNAAIPASPDLRYIVPGKYHIGHDYSVPLESWPVDSSGRDLSWYKNNDFDGSKSYFVVGAYDNFFGAYYQNSDSGYGHWALYPDIPGKKIWIWDLSRAGEIWVDLLTDSDGQYSEPQAGRLLNQSDHGSFPPAASDLWKEIWFSYQGIGQMVGAQPSVVLSLYMKNNSYILGLYALEKIKDRLVVKEGQKEILSQRLNLEPAQTKLLDLGRLSEPGNLSIYLGNKIIHQTNSQAKELKRPFNFHRPAGNSPEDLYLAGQTLENERDYSGALEKYIACLRQEPNHLRALNRVAEIYFRRGEYYRAFDSARRALEISMYDPDSNFLYGIAARKLNQTTEAKESLGWAARSPAFAVPAYLQLAQIALGENDYSLGEEYARRAIRFDQENPLPYELLATVLRLQGQKEKARKVCQKILELDPLDHIARYELYLLQPSPENLKSFEAFVRNEFPEETFMEIALHYLDIGKTENAHQLFELASKNLEALVWLAYLDKNSNPDVSHEYLEKAAAASPYLVFPFREESLPVLTWASQKMPDNWKFRYYLGLIYWHLGRLEEAREMFKSLDSADYYPVFIARAYLNPENQEQSYLDLKKARSLSPEAWRPWHHLINFELRQVFNDSALSDSLQALEKFPENIYIQSDTVKALLASGQFLKAAELLDKMRVLPYEGASEVHSLYLRVHLHLALKYLQQKDWNRALAEIILSREYPESLGTGRPFDPDQRIQDYLEAICYEHLGETDKAKQKYVEIINYTEKFPDGPYAYFGALALEKCGQKEKAFKIKKGTKPPEEFARQIAQLDY